MDRHAGRPAAPPYEGEGPHALWHFSEDSTIEIFHPQGVAAGPPSNADEPFVWAVEPIERVEVGDLLAMHAAAGIELRFTPSIWPWWVDVAFSSLEFSGSRLRNCAAPMPEVLAQL